MRVFIVLLALASPAVAQQVYRCADAKGQPVFQQAPCDGARSGAVKVSAANVIDSAPPGDAGLRAGHAREQAVGAAIAQGRIEPGMTADEVRRAWGVPTTINTDIYQSGVQHQLVYRGKAGTSYVYLKDGLVVSTQDRPQPLRRRDCRPVEFGSPNC